MTDLTFNPIGGYWLVAAIAIVLVALLWVKPRHVRLSPIQTAVLVALRLLVVLLTVTAMLRPTLVYKELKTQRASLLILIDASRSMQVEDSFGNASRWSTMTNLLAQSADDMAALADKLKVRAYTFDAETKPVDLVAGKLELPQAPEGGQTALGAAIEEVLDREASTRVLGVVVLSDGAQRAIAPRDLPPQLAVRRMAAENVPLYSVALGQPGGSGRADLAIDDLVTSSTIFAGAPTDVGGRLQSRGYANLPVRVQLLWENDEGEMEVVDTAQVTTGVAGEPVPVRLRYTPPISGERKVTLRAEPREGELVTSNNEASTFVTVREGGIRVLYLIGAQRIGGTPGVEQRYVRDALAASPDIAVERRLFDYRQTELDLRELFAPDKFDVVILDNVDAVALNEASWKLLAELVQGGKGIMVTGGFHSFGPGGYGSLPVKEVLPIGIGPAERQNFDEPLRTDVHITEPVKMRPAEPLGTQSPVMQLGDAAGEADWNELPPLDGANLLERRRLRPNAQVLAESDDEARHPLLVAGQPGNGRTLAFAGDSTWHWPMEGHAEAHRRFWRQCVLWLAKMDERQAGRVWIRLASRRVGRGSRVDFVVGATDSQLAAVAEANFEVQIERPDGNRVQVRPAMRGDDWSASFRETGIPGDYNIHVTARDGDKVLGTAQARFLVPDQDLELDRPAADPGLLAQLATLTADAGGQALAPEELPSLLDHLAAEPPKFKEEVRAKVTYWDTWPFFLLFVLLLAVEWYLRKRWGLV